MKKTLTKTDKIAIPVIIALSVLVPIVVLILMNLPERYNLLGAEAGTFPLFHAVLNGSTAVLLLMGFFFMRIKEYKLHRNVRNKIYFFILARNC